MAYQLDFLAVVGAIFVPANFLLYFILLAAVSIPLVFLAYQLKKGVPFRPLRLSIAWVVMAPVGILLVCMIHIGSGWQLEQEQLQIKTNIWSSESIELERAEVALVDSIGPWRATGRGAGLGLPGLCVGRFKFQNGERALYFRHLESPQRVVLKVDDRYFVLAHPGVEDLYRELVARGVKQYAQ